METLDCTPDFNMVSVPVGGLNLVVVPTGVPEAAFPPKLKLIVSQIIERGGVVAHDYNLFVKWGPTHSKLCSAGRMN